jgi:hypothetical protein
MAGYSGVVSANLDNDIASILLWICEMAAGGGAILLAIGAVEGFRMPHPPVAPNGIPGLVTGNVRWIFRPSNPRPFAGLSSYGTISAIFYLLVYSTVLTFQASALLTPVGLRVRLTRPGVVGQSFPGIHPLLLRLVCCARRDEPILYLDSQAVSWEELGGVLQKELRYRPSNWPVYVQGDPSMEFGWVAKAVDAIEGLHACVVLLTGTDLERDKQR